MVYIPVYNTCTLLENNVKYVDANLDAPDNAISDNITIICFIHYYISYCKKKICQAKFSFFFEEGKYYV